MLETLPGFTLSGNLYRPVGKTGKLAAVLCPHGHWADGRVNPEVQQRCIRLAKLGFVVFMYDMVGYNDSKSFGHTFLNDRLRRWGLSLVSLQTWDSIRVLDWISSLPDVDPTRIGCTGESGGGTQTFLLTAVDDRIAVAAPIVMVSDYFRAAASARTAPGCASAPTTSSSPPWPRPMKLVGATGDWTARTMTHAYPAIRQVYQLLGKPERLSADLFDYKHNYNQTSRNAVYPFLAHWLLGLDASVNTDEGDQKVEKPEDLWTFTKETPAPTEPKTPAALENDLVRLLTWQIEALSPASATAPATWDASRSFLATSHRIRTGIVSPPAPALAATEVRRVAHGDVTLVHSWVGRRAVGESIPVLRAIPKNATGKLTVLMVPGGKAAFLQPGSAAGGLAMALLARGQSVVAFDPLFVGESVDAAKPALKRPDTAHFETYNHGNAGEQLQDLATVVAWATLPARRALGERRGNRPGRRPGSAGSTGAAGAGSHGDRPGRLRCGRRLGLAAGRARPAGSAPVRRDEGRRRPCRAGSPLDPQHAERPRSLVGRGCLFPRGGAPPAQGRLGDRWDGRAGPLARHGRVIVDPRSFQAVTPEAPRRSSRGLGRACTQISGGRSFRENDVVHGPVDARQHGDLGRRNRTSDPRVN
ncbi:MAG: CocE/NonD family hydrolase [Isosphaeraceae bacterium]